MVILVVSLYETFNIHWPAIEVGVYNGRKVIMIETNLKDNYPYLNDYNSGYEKIKTESNI